MRMTLTLAGFLIAITTTLAFAAGIPAEKMSRPAGTTAYRGDHDELLAYGEQLWNDKSLSRKGKTACASCHKGNTRMFKKTFLTAYPHQVKMPKKKSGLTTVDAEQMVQFCMLAPMKTETLDWESKELAALTAYSVEVVQKAYIESKTKK